jgi:hypothetical protein
MQLDHQNPATGSVQPTLLPTAPVEQILSCLASDKSVASFQNAFGCDLDSNDTKEAATLEAAAAAEKPDLLGIQFLFSLEQVACKHKKAIIGGSESNLANRCQ